MRTRPFHLLTTALVTLLVTFCAGSQPLDAQTRNGTAPTGQVTSDREGPMGGVLVSAKKAGSTITVKLEPLD